MNRILVPMLLVAPLCGQEARDAEQLLRAKLDSAFLRRADWTTDYDEAKRRAAERDQPIFGYFTTAGP